MEELAESFVVEQFDQLRAIAHPLRARILELLIQRPMTMSQLGEVFGETVAKMHYHVRELESLAFCAWWRNASVGGSLKNITVPWPVRSASPLLFCAQPLTMSSAKRFRAIWMR
jgi:predicted transcriptional regulator